MGPAAGQQCALPITGARTVEQLSGNIGAADIALSAVQIGRLDDVSEVPAGNPYFMPVTNRNELTSGKAERFEFGTKPIR